MPVVFKKRILMLVFVYCFVAIPFWGEMTHAANLSANFRLFGEINRFYSLGRGDVELTIKLNNQTIGQGRIDFPIFDSPMTTGVFKSLSLPNINGSNIVDYTFSVPFSMDAGEEASLSISLKCSGMYTIFDFSDDISFTISEIPSNATDQGLRLNSVVMEEGSSISEEGWTFELVSENSIFKYKISEGANIFSEEMNPPGTISTSIPSGLGTVSIEAPNLSNPSFLFSFCPEPNPPIEDLVHLNFLGANNVRLIQSNGGPPNLDEAILILRVLVGESVDNVDLSMDYTSNEILDLGDVLWILRSIAGS